MGIGGGWTLWWKSDPLPWERGLASQRNLLLEIENAERRAEQQQARRAEEGDEYARPSTTVWKLTSAIREAAKKSAIKASPGYFLALGAAHAAPVHPI